MSRLARLKDCKSISDLGEVLGIEPKILAHRIYKIPESDKYSSFTIPKKSGGVRLIEAPDSRLRFVQRRLSNLLQDCVSEIERAQGVELRCAHSHGFRRKRSILTNARRHRNRRWVFNCDISDFFPSIHFGRIQGYFLKNSHFALDAKISTIIAQIACHRGQLPQGSPCSPIISDLVASIMDKHLGDMATKYGCTYTRYADDITFSTNKKAFPHQIARPRLDTLHDWAVGDELASRLFRAGFTAQASKSRMQYKDSRQSVTGVITNKKINVPDEFYKTTRAMCDHLFRHGFFFQEGEGPEFGPILGSPGSLRGRLSYIYNVKTIESGRRRILNITSAPNYYKLYRKYLDYFYFYGNDRITLVTEGHTDIIYIDSALRSLYKSYPTLTSAEDGSPNLGYYRNSLISDSVHHFSGGSGDFTRLINRFKYIAHSYSVPGQNSPVIILIDNDSGATDIFKTVGTITKAKVDGSKSFYHVVDNLYIVTTPPKSSGPSMVEDFFTSATLKQKLGGKRLQLDAAKFTKDKHFGKNHFANHVVRPNRKTIDFSGFVPLLDRIVAVQKDFASRPK